MKRLIQKEPMGNSAFTGCSGLTSVTLPSTALSIGDYAFSGCPGLTSMIIPNSVETIGQSAFYGCSGLITVTIPNSVTSIGIHRLLLLRQDYSRDKL